MRAADASASSARVRARNADILALHTCAVSTYDDARAVRGESVGTRVRAGRRRFF